MGGDSFRIIFPVMRLQRGAEFVTIRIMDLGLQIDPHDNTSSACLVT